MAKAKSQAVSKSTKTTTGKKSSTKSSKIGGYNSQHSIGYHMTLWYEGEQCFCKFWGQDEMQFEKEWEETYNESRSIIRVPAYNYCPLCDDMFKEGHSHDWKYFTQRLGDKAAYGYRNAWVSPKTDAEMEKMIKPAPTDPTSVYRLRVIDRDRKLAIQRVLKGRRRVAVSQACQEMSNLLTHTRLTSKVALVRCEPITPEK